MFHVMNALKNEKYQVYNLTLFILKFINLYLHQINSSNVVLHLGTGSLNKVNLKSK